MSAPLGFLGLVALVLWVSAPRMSILDGRALLASVLRNTGTPADGVGADEASLAVVNPMNVPGVRVTRGPEIIPVNDENGDGLGGIVIVTPTPDSGSLPVPTAASTADAAGGQSGLSWRGAGVVLADQQVPEAESDTQVSGDDTALSELLAPLLEDQIDPTPLVIELEIPSAVKEVGPSGLGALDLRLPSGGAKFPQVVLLPTATPENVPEPSADVAVGLPVVEIVPAVGVKFTPTPTPLPTATPVVEITPSWSTSSGPTAGRKWSEFEPRPPESSDHFWVANPFGTAANSYASPNYQFGSTAGGRYRPHHGVDISNPTGTPIQAGVKGEVVFAGADDVETLGPYNNFYGNAVVIRLDRRLPVAGGRLDVFVLYGHLSAVRATVGQRVEPTDVVGLVGMTGIAIGPHLHVEVRLGANTYSHNVNPYLWLEPRPGNGAVAIRLLTRDGNTWAGAKISIARFEGGAAVWARQIETYLDTENIGPDPAWGENGAMGDVPAGDYYLIGSVNGESIRAEFPVAAGQTTFVEVRTQQ